MNINIKRILLVLKEYEVTNQRKLANILGCSLGTVNSCLNKLIDNNYITNNYLLTNSALKELEINKPSKAIILAAGLGMRMVPINTIKPKGLLEVKGEILIERLIKQLHDVGIFDIYIVVGFMKECFEYLVDEFGVKLIINNDYANSNSLHSLFLVREYIENTYIIPSDIYCCNNPFHRYELFSWYMLTECMKSDSYFKINRNKELCKINCNEYGNRMVGISYINRDSSSNIIDIIVKLRNDKFYNQYFWEECLKNNKNSDVYGNVVDDDLVVEINTYEQLREFDSCSNNLKSDAIDIICGLFGVNANDVKNIKVMKKGITNRSFQYECNGNRYVMRIPGEGTDVLIDRYREEEAYLSIQGKGYCDDPVYLNPSNGYKIAKYLPNVRSCNAYDDQDLIKCMSLLRKLHGEKLQVKGEFNIWDKINFYESLWNGKDSLYKDYNVTKEKVMSLRNYIDQYKESYCLTHIDAVSDNFLFYYDDNGNENLQLTDWEYASMQDPHVDLAVFSLYEYYDKIQVDHLINIYFQGTCDNAVRLKIYCYISAIGLAWSNWSEYKIQLGVELGDYAIQQYSLAKKFYRYFIEEHKINE